MHEELQHFTQLGGTTAPPDGALDGDRGLPEVADGRLLDAYSDAVATA